MYQYIILGVIKSETYRGAPSKFTIIETFGQYPAIFIDKLILTTEEDKQVLIDLGFVPLRKFKGKTLMFQSFSMKGLEIKHILKSIKQ